MARGLLFVTRKFPPSVGGMQTLAAGVWRVIRRHDEHARLIALGRSNRNLVWWFPFAAARTAWLLARRRADRVLAGDALTYAVLRPIARMFRAEAVTMIMGRDVTYDSPLYRAVVHRALARAPSVLAISDATAAEAVAVGVDPRRVQVVRLGVSAPQVSPADRSFARDAVLTALRVPRDTFVLLTIGRLVRRKGVRWFVANVLPALPSQVHYAVAGTGPERDAIAAAATEHGVADRVHLLGAVDDARREQLLRGADLFAQPNIPVPGDLEGFGLVIVEASMRGTPVVAADLQGIRDAVVDGTTGWLLPAGVASAWIAAVDRRRSERDALPTIGSTFQRHARDRYGEDAMASHLLAALYPDRGR